MEKTMLFIINPRSGRGLIRNRLMEVLDLFCKEGYEVSVYVTQRSMEATKVAAEQGRGKDLVVLSGGDGTLNEVISGIMEIPALERPEIGYIPAGSTNDYASSLKLPRQILPAARMALFGNGGNVDVGQFCNERYFVYLAGFGAFTEVSYLTPQDKKNVLGHQAYMLEGVKSLSAIKSYSMKVICEELELEGDFIFGMVTNTISVGGFKGLVSQDVALSDGMFEVLLIRTPKTPLDLSNIVSSLFLKEDNSGFVHKFKTRSLRFFAKEPVDWVLDGEFGGTKSEVLVENLRECVSIRRLLPKNLE